MGKTKKVSPPERTSVISPFLLVSLSSAITAFVAFGGMALWQKNAISDALYLPGVRLQSSNKDTVKGVNFVYPYDFSWKEHGTIFEVVRLEYGTGIVSSRYLKYPNDPQGKEADDKRRLSLQLKLSTLDQNVAPRVTLRYLSDSQAEILTPDSSDFIFPENNGGSYALSNSTYSNRFVSFTIPEKDNFLVVKFPDYYMVISNLRKTVPTVKKVTRVADLPLRNRELVDKL